MVRFQVNSIANMDSPTISFPKYNNYIQDKKNFDPYSRVLIPLNILGIENVKPGTFVGQTCTFMLLYNVFIHCFNSKLQVTSEI